MKAKQEGRTIREHEYGRYGNPTQQECERKLAAVEGAERALLFSTGMSAVILTLMTYMQPKSHIIFTSDCYRQTRDFATNMLSRFGVKVSLVDPTAVAIEKAIRPNTHVIFTESPTNPYLRVLDLPAIVKVAKRHQAWPIIDATLATPYNIKPLNMGIDIVIHSGHEVLRRPQRPARRRHARQARPPELSVPHAADDRRHAGALHLFPARTGTEDVRAAHEAAQQLGLAVARMLESHPKIEKVWYPALASHPDHAIAKKQMKGFGSVITFLVKGGDRETRKFIDSLELFLITPSLGGSESLVTQMSMMSFFDCTEEYRLNIGIVDNLVRIALGLEDVEDLITDLEQALDRI